MIAEKLPILKQDVKTINAEIIRTCALSQLSFVQFRPYATSFQWLRLSLTLMLKSKKTLRRRSRPPLTKGLKALFRMLII